MPIPFLMLPPQSEKTRKWAKAVAEACPELEIIIPETREGAEQAIALAEGAYGTIPKELLPRAGHLRWLQAPQAGDVVHLPEATALIVGVGGIGAEAARLAAAFGIKVIGVDERRPDKPEGVAEMHRAPALDSLLPRADFVILTVPHTPETE